jgi:hypothetical protein
MAVQDVECGLCGLSLGLGIPGSRKWCEDCEGYVLAKAEHGDAGAVVGAAIAVGAGLLAAYALSRMFGNRR